MSARTYMFMVPEHLFHPSQAPLGTTYDDYNLTHACRFHDDVMIARN
jgi:hypothetical protein